MFCHSITEYSLSAVTSTNNTNTNFRVQRNCYYTIHATSRIGCHPKMIPCIFDHQSCSTWFERENTALSPVMHLPHTGSFLLPGGQLENKPVIGISASETSVSYRLLCRALSIKFKVCDHKGYDTSVPCSTVEFRSFGNFEKDPHPTSHRITYVSPRNPCISTGDVFPPPTTQQIRGVRN